MIIDFSIENFGSIKTRQTLSFEATSDKDLEEYYVVIPDTAKKIRLLKMAIIYGANASGKTTVLNALEFLRSLVIDSVSKKSDTLKFKPFLFDQQTPHLESKLWLNFVHSGIKFAYEVSFTQQAVTAESLYYFHPRKSLLFKRTTDLTTQITHLSKVGEKAALSPLDIEILTKNTLWNTSVLASFNKLNISSEAIKMACDWFQYTLNLMISPQTHLPFLAKYLIENKIISTDIIANKLQQADFHINDIQLIEKALDEDDIKFIARLEESSELSKKEKERTIEKIKNHKDIVFQHTVENHAYALPFEEESRGTQAYFGMAGLLAWLSNHPTMVQTIDEFEYSLHPDLIKHFLLTYLKNSTQTQLLLTTHYRELLHERDILREDVIWFTEKNAEAATELFCLADFETATIRKTSSIYNAYKIGKLGAVPNIEN